MESDFSLFEYIAEDEPDPESSRATANIYQVEKDGTMLHRAIRKGDQRWIDDILEVYQADFNKIRKYLVKKYRFDPNEKIWLRKINLIALDENQCRSCKEFENGSDKCENLDKAIFVVLKIPINGEEVAVLPPNDNNRLDVFRLLRDILPNGCISWNYPGIQLDPNGRDETFVETAILCGKNDMVTKLLELGAYLSFPYHNALIAACLSYREDTIHWLLTEHFDDFDCTQRTSNQMNAFLLLMQRKKLKMMDFVIKKMISYREKYFNETESEAFNEIFHYNNEDNNSTLTLIRQGPIQDKVEQYIVQYRLDLSFQRKGVTILECLLSRKMALDYCWGEIRRNPKLLGLEIYDESTILHSCLRMGFLDNLSEIYEAYPEVKQFFEKEDSFGCLEGALFNNCRESAIFMLENHSEYFLRHPEELKQKVILRIYNNQEFCKTNGELLVKYFPVFKTEIDQQMTKDPEFHLGQDFRLAFQKFDLEFHDCSINIKDPSLTLSSIKGLKGITLLHYAANENNTKLFSDLLEAGCDISAVDVEGNHPIHYVQSTAMFDLIIDKHPNKRSLVHHTNCEGQTVLHRICSFSLDDQELIALMEKIIKYGGNVNQLTNNGESVVFMIGSCTVLDFLQKYNINLETINHEGQSVLERHLKYRNVSVARSLLHLLHKLPSFKDHAHKYLEPFMYLNRDFFSCDYQPFLEANPETTKLIFDSVYNHSRDDASRLFLRACCSAHIFLTEKFLEFNYDLDYNYQDQDGYTPIIGLLSYMEESNIHLVRQLIVKRVNLELRNHWGRNALLALTCRFRSAKWYGHDVETVQLLLDHGAQIDSIDNDGNSALHFAFMEHELELAQVLMENGANISMRNKENKAPIQMAPKINGDLFKFMI